MSLLTNMESDSEQRRSFLKKICLASLGLFGAGNHISCQPAIEEGKSITPPALKRGCRIALTAPAGAVFYPERIASFVKVMNEILDIEVVKCESLHSKHGYFSGKDEFRAKELNSLFKDKTIDGIIAIRGGWGCSRILPLLDYEVIKNNPKVIMGFSDITALLLGIYAKTGLTTFHGPMGYSEWGEFTINNFQSILIKGEATRLLPPPEDTEGIVSLVGGKAQGILIGGNLTILTSLLGTPYLPNFAGKILFVEEINEEAYRIDRMLTQLKLAGVFDNLSGFIFGKCIQCEPEFPEKALSFWEVLDEVIKPLGIPAFCGITVGHLKEQFIMPIGSRVAIDANLGTIALLEAAVRL